MNDKYVAIKSAKILAEYLSELERQGVTYFVVSETDGSWSVLITGY